ncbi:MAG TPA: GDP-mannose 4,6-dehydratase [Thermoanaerobaculia bacterium]|nr:GDP-mannose 4,6-dehydratase [Thermoanaerobaculia bacterium]
MRVLVTGAGGFVGRHLARLLVAEGDRVAGTCWGECLAIPGVELHEADVRDRASVERVVRQVRPEVVVHLAGLSHVGQSWERPGCYFAVNVTGTENVVRSAGGARVLIASSADVYGAVPEAEQPIGEERALEPGTPYGATKAAAERLAVALAGPAAVVVRSFNLIGPGQSRDFALPSFAAQLAAIRRGEAEPMLQVGNLSARRDFVHVEAAARAYALLARRGEGRTAYNLASGRARSMAEVLEALIRLSGVEARVERDPARFRPVDLPLLCGDPSRLRALGWEPEPGVDEAIAGLWREAASTPSTS